MKSPNRRDILKALLTGGACAFTGGRLTAASSLSVNEIAAAAHSKRLLFIFLRGGNDGVNTVVPVGDTSYATMRANVRVDGTSLVLNGTSFAKAHSALAPVVRGAGSPHAMGRMAWMHQVGNPVGARSHFYEMDVHEALDLPATVGGAVNAEGWVARLAGWANWSGTLPAAGMSSFFRAFHAPATLPASKILAEIRDIDDYDIQNGAGVPEPIDAQVTNLLSSHLASVGYSGAPGDVAAYAKFATQTMALVDTLPTFISTSPVPTTTGITAPESLHFLAQVESAMRLLFFVPECRVVGVNFGGFDTHADQLVRQEALLKALASALRYVHDMSQSLGPGFDDNMLTLVVSEFGRTAKDNGTVGSGVDPNAGTDHGLGNLYMAMGKLVVGGVFNCDVSTWGNVLSGNDLLAQQAGLASTLVDANAIPVRTDFRSIYAEILQKWFGVPAARLNNVLLDLNDPSPPVLTQLGFIQ